MLFQKSSQREYSAILLSVKPRFANLIVEGSKRIELRRVIPARQVGTIVIYASSPRQQIVALADVTRTIEATPAKLWALSKVHGGGLSQIELLTYFEFKTSGFAFMLENVRVFKKPIQPSKIFKTFLPPQSFKYLSAEEIQKVELLLLREN